MTIASGSYHGLLYEEEDAWGVLNTAPGMAALRHTSCSLNLTKDGYQSSEIRSDRMITDFRHGVIRAQGDIGIEFSFAEYDTILEAALFGEWETDVLVAGKIAKSFTIERQFTDITQYGLFTGCMCSTFSLEIPANGMVTGSIGFVGKGASYSGAARDAEPADSETHSPFDSFTGTIEEGGSAIAVVTSLSLSLNNGIEPAFVLGSNTAAQNIIGRSNLTGTLTAYFEDASLLAKFIAETESSIELVLWNGETQGTPAVDINKYTILIPRVKYTGGDNPVSGEGAITISLPFQGLYDSVTETNLQITRVPATA